MQVQFPLFILEKDDRSMRMVSNSKELGWYEQIDIKEDLYEGWDINGYPIKLIWDPQIGPKIEILEEKSHIDQLINAIKDYARDYRPKVPFNYSGSNVVSLFKAVEDHIAQGKLSYKIKMKLKGLCEKKVPGTL